MSMLRELVTIAILVHQALDVEGHGRLIDPPSRASMWRYGFDTPPDYNDNQGFCGGSYYQQNLGGKCGICGDPWDARVRQHEAGGKYATGTIVKNYQVGQIITVKVELTANHLGYFEFRLCVNNNVNKAATHECLNLNLLKLADGTDTKYQVDTTLGIHTVQLRLPGDVVCSQCVFQWRYHTGNSWGVDSTTGKRGLGLGPQEEFYGCADISISGAAVKQPKSGPPKPSFTSASQTTVRHTTVKSPTATVLKKTPGTTAPIVVPDTDRGCNEKIIANNCYAIGAFKGNPDYNEWCVNNCAMKNCPSNYCACGDDIDDGVFSLCVSYGVHKSVSMDTWCKVSCQLKNCPASLCKCYLNVIKQ